MSDFERLDNAWEQAEQSRHAALLRQLKAEAGIPATSTRCCYIITAYAPRTTVST